MLYVLDASAILNDFGFSFNKKEKYVTTNPVFDECRDMRSRLLVQNALSNGILQIRDPLSVSEKKAKQLANSLEHKRLSLPDVSVLGLSIELLGKEDFVLITDDHGLQFVCKRAGIPFEAVIRGKTKKKPRKAKTTKKGAKKTKSLQVAKKPVKKSNNSVKRPSKKGAKPKKQAK
jgi:endoribonuclease Nob1